MYPHGVCKCALYTYIHDCDGLYDQGDLFQGGNGAVMEEGEAAGLISALNDRVFEMVEGCNPNVPEWADWWIQSARFCQTLRYAPHSPYSSGS